MTRSRPQPIERIWPDSTVVCIGGGPSLTREDVEYVYGRAKIIAINNAYQLLPEAALDSDDVALYCCDARFWQWHEGVPGFKGRRFGMTPNSWPRITFVRNLGDRGFSKDPRGVYTGRNSGYQVMQLAVIFGAKRVLLLGYDMMLGTDRSHHWFGAHPNKQAPPVNVFLKNFSYAAQDIKKSRVEIVNCSRRTALEMFPKMTIEEALP